MDEMRTMVARGASPEDMAKYFGIAISSVHNYKKLFKKEGLSFPTVRGRRPKARPQQTPLTATDLSRDMDEVEKVTRMVLAPQMPSAPTPDDEVQTYKVIVKNKMIEIKGDITNIVIKRDSIEIVV